MTNGMDKTGDAMRRIKTYLIIVNLIFLTGCANKEMGWTVRSYGVER